MRALSAFPSVVLLAAGAPLLPAQEMAPVSRLPDFTITQPLVANPAAAAAIDMPVSGLRYEPRVDLQARNLGEAQADVAIRGGIFENSGFKLGALALYDPQTGHYFAEIPVSPAMLGAPRVATGAENALAGFNASVGTIAYGWKRIQAGGVLSAGAGDHGFERQSVYAAGVRETSPGGARWAADAEWTRSASDGSVPFGDHDFQRAGARLQAITPFGQTDLYAGYQAKFFGWPNLYTPFGFNETENLQTVLVAANHRRASADGSFWEAGAYYRRNKDDYEFNRAVPGASNPFLHTTWVRAAALEGRLELPGWAVDYRAAVMSDDLRSTSLTVGPPGSRTYVKAGLAAERTLSRAAGEWRLRGGVAWDDATTATAEFSPLAVLEWRTPDGACTWLEYSAATQLPTYTALKSSATSGLFRGNASLGRETSRNLEAAVARRLAGWDISAALFRREDADLVDWTYRQGVVARTANAVDITTAGVELLARRRVGAVDVVLGYTWLGKDADYGASAVEASFYALNFARHRLTVALTWRIAPGWELRSDNEFRLQQDNLLRTAGGDEAALSSLGLYFRPPGARRWEISAMVDNVWDSRFEEVPAVPAGRRQMALGLAWRW